MSKKLIEGKGKGSKRKKMSHTGGNSRPIKNVYRDEVSGKWFKIKDVEIANDGI